VGDHSADSTVKNLGRSTVMEGTAGGLDITPLPQDKER
jgi:hypothetical protein